MQLTQKLKLGKVKKKRHAFYMESDGVINLLFSSWAGDRGEVIFFGCDSGGQKGGERWEWGGNFLDIRLGARAAMNINWRW